METFKPLLSLCLIVKNEGKQMISAIESVSSIVDEIIIVDTGSTDDTVKIAREYSKFIALIPWTDNFSKARNVSLEMATGEWILVLDADETVHPEDLTKLTNTIQSTKKEGFFVQIINRKDEFVGYQEEYFSSLRLFRNRSSYRFSGAIHEQISSTIPQDQLTVTDIRLFHHGNLPHFNKNKQRGFRNIRILEKELAEEPSNEFQRFNLGAEYVVKEDYKLAIKQFGIVKEQLKEAKPQWLSRFYKLWTYCLIKEKQWEEANQSLEQGNQRFPYFPDLYYLKGMLYIAQEKYKEALFPLYTCLAIGDVTDGQLISEKGMGSFKPYYILGSVYESLGEEQKAKICYQNALQSYDAHIDSGIALVRLLLQEQSIQQITFYLKTIFNESNPTHVLTMAKICLENKLYATCHTYVTQALKLYAPRDKVYYLQGLCYYHEGKTKEMKESFLQLDRSSPFYYHSRLMILLSDWDIQHVQEWKKALVKYDLFRETPYVDLVKLSLEEILAKLQEGEGKFPDSMALIKERKIMEKWYNLLLKGEDVEPTKYN